MTFIKSDIITENIIKRNPVISLLFGVYPVVAVTVSLRNAVTISEIIIIIMILTGVITAITDRLHNTALTVSVYITIPALTVMTAEAILYTYYPESYTSLGISLPLAATGTVITAYTIQKRNNTDTKNNGINNGIGNDILSSLIHTATAGVGFAAVMIIVATVRELFGRGTLYDIVIFNDYSGIPFLLMPAGALILLGIISAVMQAVTGHDFVRGGERRQ